MSGYHELVRAAYALDLSDEAWVLNLAATARRVFRTNAWAYGLRLDGADPERIIYTSDGFEDSALAGALAAHRSPSLEDVRSLYGGGPFASLWSERARELRPTLDAMGSEFLHHAEDVQRQVGHDDTLGLYGGSADGGCMICAPAPAGGLSPRTRWALRRVAVHLDAAWRLRSARPQEPEAWLTENGEILEQRVNLDEESAEIQRGAHDLKTSQEVSARDPERAVAIWRGLVSGKWSLVRATEQGGRRVLLLRRNEVRESRGTDAGWRRAASVAALVARGHSNKFIAYELGLPISTVASDIRRMVAQLGLSGRADLIGLGTTSAPVSSSDV